MTQLDRLEALAEKRVWTNNDRWTAQKVFPDLIRVARAAKAVRVDEFMEGKAGVVRGLEELWTALAPLFAEVES